MSIGVKVERQTLSITVGTHSSKGVAVAGYGAEWNLAANGGRIGGNCAIAIAGRILRSRCASRLVDVEPDISLSIRVSGHSLVGKDQILSLKVVADLTHCRARILIPNAETPTKILPIALKGQGESVGVWNGNTWIGSTKARIPTLNKSVVGHQCGRRSTEEASEGCNERLWSHKE